MIKKGDFIPDFRLKNADGEWVTIKKEHKKKRLIYFYPKDQTQECTKQACSLQKWQADFIRQGYEVIGISSDSVKSHDRFRAKYQLNFELLSDPGGVVRKQFGASKMLGLIPLRVTYLTNEEGKVVFQHSAMLNGEEHVEKALSFINNRVAP